MGRKSHQGQGQDTLDQHLSPSTIKRCRQAIRKFKVRLPDQIHGLYFRGIIWDKGEKLSQRFPKAVSAPEVLTGMGGTAK